MKVFDERLCGERTPRRRSGRGASSAPEYEAQVVVAFDEQIGARLARRGETTPKMRNHEPPALVVPLALLGMANPLPGVAGGRPGSAGVVFVCLM